jgi:hypothetical protein
MPVIGKFFQAVTGPFNAPLHTWLAAWLIRTQLCRDGALLHRTSAFRTPA